jgi:hypothetical protein
VMSRRRVSYGPHVLECAAIECFYRNECVTEYDLAFHFRSGGCVRRGLTAYLGIARDVLKSMERRGVIVSDNGDCYSIRSFPV